MLSELAAHEFDNADIELEPPAFGTVDLLALDMAQRMSAELTEKAAPNDLYLDSLVTLFGIHLLRTYTSRRKHAVSPKGEAFPPIARDACETTSKRILRKNYMSPSSRRSQGFHLIISSYGSPERLEYHPISI